MKICKKCLKVLPFSDFYKYKKSKDRFRYECIPCFKLIKKMNQINNIDKQKLYVKKYNKTEKGKKTTRKYNNKYYAINKNKIIPRIVSYTKNRRKVDPIFKLKMNLVTRLNSTIKRKKLSKKNKFKDWLGCTLIELKKHLANKFQSGMNWENHSINGWHIDHIIPLSSAKNEEELYRLCHYTNLQPLWAKENLSKGAKWR